MSDLTLGLEAVFDEHIQVARATRALPLDGVAELAGQISSAFAVGGRLVVFGNGG